MSRYQVALHEAAHTLACLVLGIGVHSVRARAPGAVTWCDVDTAPPADAAVVFACGYLIEDMASWSESTCRGDDLAELSRLSAVVPLAAAYRSALDLLTGHAAALYDLAGRLAAAGEADGAEVRRWWGQVQPVTTQSD